MSNRNRLILAAGLTLPALFLGCRAGVTGDGGGVVDLRVGVKHDLTTAGDDAATGDDAAITKPDLASGDDAATAGDDAATAGDDAAMSPGDMAMPIADLAMPAADLRGADLRMPKMDLVMPPPPADGGAPGTKIQSGAVDILGTTTDNFVVYGDLASDTLYVAPVAGGKAISLGKGFAAGVAGIRGKVVFYWTAISNNGVGTLAMWNSAAGLKASAATASMVGLATANEDGTYLAFSSGAAKAGTSTQITLATSDLVTTRPLFANPVGFDLGAGTTCSPTLRLAGTRFLAATCQDPLKTAASIVEIDMTKLPGMAPAGMVIVQAALPFVQLDKTGTTGLYLDPTGVLNAIPAAGGASTKIDTTVGYAYINGDGKNTLYRTTSGMAGGAAKISTLVAPKPTTLVMSGVQFFNGRSPDDQWFLYSTKTDGTGALNDLYLGSEAMAQTVALNKNATSAPNGAPFTTDGSHALYYTSIALDMNNVVLSGTLNAIPTAGGMAAALGTKVYYDLAATGSKVVFNDNYSTVTGLADLKSVDTAGGAATTVAAKADPSFALTADKATIVYSLSTPMNAAGLYTSPLP